MPVIYIMINRCLFDVIFDVVRVMRYFICFYINNKIDLLEGGVLA